MTYDAIVLGTGGVGSATVYHLAKRGLRVLGIDRFQPPHDRGSSHGQTRIIRQAYFEHPDYVPLLRRAYQLWEEMETLRGEQLFHRVGLLEVGPADGVVVPGVLESARQYDLEVEQLAPDEAAKRFPGFAIPEGYRAVFEPQAGYLAVEKCIEAHLAEAQKLGAELHGDETVVGWSVEGDGVKVETEKATYHAGQLIVTAGAWAGPLLKGLGIPLRVLRKHLHWFEPNRSDYHQDQGGPTFFYETPAGYYYGFPQIDENGVKMAEHSGGSEVADPLNDERQPESDERGRVESFLTDYLPGVSTVEKKHAVCFYTMSPDEHFVVDRHPQHAQVAFAAGLSGHGFKFAGVLGEVLTDLVLDGHSEQPIDFLRCSRFA